MKTRRRGKPKRRHNIAGINGAPKTIVPLEFERGDEPENYPSLIRYLEKNGRITHTPQALMYKARSMFLRGMPFDSICKKLNLKPHIVERWAVIFGWEEKRDQRLFQKFRKGLGLQNSKNIRERHDRIAGTIESAIERLLHLNTNGKSELSPRELNTIASTLKTTADIRTTLRGEKTDKSEKKVDVNLNMPSNIEALAGALLAAGSSPKEIEAPKTKRISVKIGESLDIDEELEREILE